jgi:hypothetical protein
MSLEQDHHHNTKLNRKGNLRLGLEIADILNRYENDYRNQYPVSAMQDKVIRAIKACRTSDLGGHINVCVDCGEITPSYNSCRNRHCPKCQGLDQLRWLEMRERELLPIQYFHVVFTLPHNLNEITPYNEKLIYNLLFRCAAQALQKFANSKWHGTLGLLGILHTWSQTLFRHTHVHFIVTGGVLTHDQKKWISCPKNYLFPKKALVRVFKALFLKGLARANEDKQLVIPFADPRYYEMLYQELSLKPWIMYCKKPFDDAEKVVRYVARYTHRVAISNQRIIDISNGNVTFHYRNGEHPDVMTLSATEFLRRFLQHILPKGYVRIRYFGILAGCHRKKKMARCRELFNLPPLEDFERENYGDLLLRLFDVDINKCKRCGGHLIQYGEITEGGEWHITGPPKKDIEAEYLSIAA